MKQTGAGGEHPRQEKQSRPWPRPGGRCAGEKAEAGREDTGQGEMVTG